MSRAWSFVRRALFDNLWLKLISLAFAIGFYSFINGSRILERSVSVPLVADMPPEDAQRELMNQLPTTITVTLSGTEAQLDGLKNVEPVRLNLSDGRTDRFDFEPTMFSLPPGVSVERIVPAALNLRWEDIISRAIRVEVRLAGAPAPGFAVAGATLVDPSSVTATGPESSVLTLQLVRAADFEITNLEQGEYRHTLALDRPPDLVTFDRKDVDAVLHIERLVKTAVFKNVAVEVIGYPKAKAKPVDIRVTGPPDAVEAVGEEALVPRVQPGPDVEKDTSALYQVIVVGPSDVSLEVVPPEVVVRF